MTTETKCQHCGADQADIRLFTCGTHTYANIRGDSCYESEIERLEAANHRLTKSLELALQIILNDSCSPAFHGTDRESVRKRWISEIREEAGIEKKSIQEEGNTENA